MVEVASGAAKKKTAKKTAKKAAKKVAKKAANGSAKAKAAKKPKSTIPVEEVVKMMGRKGGVTVKQANDAGYWQPMSAAVKAAERRELKPTQDKIEGSPTVYSCNK